MRITILLLFLSLVPATAEAYTFGSRTSSAGTSRFELRVGAQLFVRARARRPDRGTTTESWDLQRARFSTSFRWGEWLRVDIEPDFGGTSADLADVFLQLEPVDGIDFRVGQSKAPWGVLESEGRYRMPSLTRGTVSDVVSDRLGFGRRKFGARLRWRGKTLPLKPTVEVGTYGQQDAEITDDLALRIGVRPLKKLQVELAAYSRAGAQSDNRRGHAASVSAHYDRRGLYGVAEIQLARVQLLSRTGLETGVDATLFAARALVAYRFPVSRPLALEPFLGGDLLDPNANTTDDMSVGFRLGVNVWWDELVRLGVQWGRETGQFGSVTSPSSALVVMLGTSIE